MTLQLQYLASTCRSRVNSMRWRLCWLLMPSLGLTQEKRRLEKIARKSGASVSVAKALASEYFNTLRDQQ